jgi:hypothetical protein
MNFFFIGGAPKSGTTWMQRALDLHPEIACSGEGHLHEFIARPINEMVTKYNAKLSAVAKIVYEDKPYLPPVSRDELLELTRVVMTMMLMRRTKPGARLIGDKTPANAHVVGDLSWLFPEMKFILMLRDPRDVAASRIGHALRSGYVDAADRDSEGYRKVVSAAAVDWRGAFEQTQDFARRRPAQCTIVRYEDLVRDPAGELARVLAFLEMETTSEQLAAIVEGSSFNALSGGREAGVEDGRSFYRKGVVGDWPNHLTDEALQILEEQCGAAMRLAGYGALAAQKGSKAAV